MERMEGIHRYEECGLKNIMLMDVPIYQCPSCNERDVEIPGMEELHLLLGILILYFPTRLKAEQVRFLRKHMGYSQEELADLMGVERGTITRWESGKTFRLDQDKHLRRLYAKKMKDELDVLAKNPRIWDVLLDKLPLMPDKEKLQLHTQDWIGEEENTCLI